ncbi:MAG TPA: hypothetical protein VK766_11680 [Cytophagaceae bacterium]|jgi:hypothetical protein|nr:hypothetical protein [Cytophagaceae bacterium]
MKIVPTKPKQYICLFSIPILTVREGSFFIFFAMDAYSKYVITYEIMPNNNFRDYKDFIKLLSDKEDINDSIIILNLKKLEAKEKHDLLNSNPQLKDIIADTISCDAFTKVVREQWEKKFN